MRTSSTKQGIPARAIFTGLALAAACILMMFGDVQERLHWLNIPGTFLLAFLAFIFLQKNTQTRSFRDFYRYAFNRDVWFHPSAVNDYVFICINVILFYAVIEYFRLDPAVGMVLAEGLMAHLPYEVSSAKPGWGVIALYTLCHIIVLDFCLFFAHWLLHKVPLLWEFHKVHHSAETLTPFTAFRIHPLETIFVGLIGALGIGFTFGVFYSLYPNLEGFLTIMGVSVGTVFFNFLGANLRHSNIWLSYGPVIERVFISPAQHRYHHSAKTKHFDKNMGFIFALWDGLFGTLYLAGEVEDIKYGLGNDEEHKPYRSVWGMFTAPLAGAARIIIGK